MTGKPKFRSHRAILNVGAKTIRAVNRIASPLDRIASVQTTDVPAPLFVLGLPRSGTTLLYELLVQAFRVGFLTRIYDYTFGIPCLTTRIVSRLTRTPRARYESRYGRIPGILAPAENFKFWMRWFPESNLFGHFTPPETLMPQAIGEANSVVGSLSSIVGAPFVFKNVYLTLSIDALLKMFKHARLIIVDRDIESIMASMYARRLELQEKRCWWSIRPPFSHQVIDRDLTEQVAFQIARSQQIMADALTRASGGQCMVLRYSEICRSPRSVIVQLQRWLPSAFHPRESASIPEKFEVRPSITIPGDKQHRMAEHAAAFSADQEGYLQKVAQRIPPVSR